MNHTSQNSSNNGTKIDRKLGIMKLRKQNREENNGMDTWKDKLKNFQMRRYRWHGYSFTDET